MLAHECDGCSTRRGIFFFSAELSVRLALLPAVQPKELATPRDGNPVLKFGVSRRAKRPELTRELEKELPRPKPEFDLREFYESSLHARSVS